MGGVGLVEAWKVREHEMSNLRRLRRRLDVSQAALPLLSLQSMAYREASLRVARDVIAAEVPEDMRAEVLEAYDNLPQPQRAKLGARLAARFRETAREHRQTG